VNKPVVWALILALLLTGCAAPSTQVSTVAEATGVLEPSQLVIASPRITVTEIAAETLTPEAIGAISPTQSAASFPIEEVIAYEMRGAFDFFWEQVNTDINSTGFGLIRDRYPGSEGISSIASTGFGLTAYLVGIEKGYISYQEGYERVDRTLDTLLTLDRTEGFYYHFLEMESGKRAWNSEVSSIDTSILLMGVLSTGEYFGGDIESKAKQIYDGVNWPWFIDESRNMFYMAYRPGKGFEGHWDFYAEQLMMYILAAGSDTYPIDNSAYYGFTRHYAKYGDGNPFIHSWFGSIFTYQFSHAWIDFRGYTDRKDVNWFDNSVEASLAQYNYAVKFEPKFNTLGPDAWGLTACDGPNGYEGRYGTPPSGFDNTQHLIDDTVPPSGAIGSIIFLPQAAKNALMNYYSIAQLKADYGFIDAYNLSEDWYASDVIGIDKGISLLMLANYQDDTVYKITMENANILNGLSHLEILRDQ
jgi:hypothetical protein